MSDNTIENIEQLFRAGALDLDKLQKVQMSLNKWQELTIKDFKDRSWIGRMTHSQIFTSLTGIAHVAIIENEKRDMQALVDSHIITVKKGVTEGHSRYFLTPFGVALAMLMFGSVPVSEGNAEVKPRDYSGLTKEQILNSIPEPHDGRILPPPHILRLFDGYEIENERPLDQELIDAVNAANEGYNDFIEVGGQ